MEVVGPRLSLSLSPIATRETSTRSQRPPRRNLSVSGDKPSRSGMLRDVRERRSPPRPMGKVVDKGAKAVARMLPANKSKPILPAAERRTGGDEARPMTRREADSGKWEIAPDGTSASREGRQFTVANVGNNGKIFLRPSVRPANQRYPQPAFVFPNLTASSTTGSDAVAVAPTLNRKPSNISGQQTPLSGPPSPPMTRRLTGSKNLDEQARHRRAVSDSTIPDASLGRKDEAGGFKVVISKPQDEQRARTTEDIGPLPSPMLQISIPSWKLGTPRFTHEGIPLIRGSSYAPTEEYRTSTCFNKSQRGDVNSLYPDPLGSRRPSPGPVMMSRMKIPSPTVLTPSSPRFPQPTRATYLSTHLVIEPEMFDYLTFKPECDDRAIVRYSSTTGAVTAATPPRLVAEITSPSFLDYELLSDFFLTFRSFMEAADLLRMLIARLKWALTRGDETGMVVRVRTFVAIRHWILNYFVDDFVVDYHLRIIFCNLLNDFVDELSHEARGRKVQLKILAELKKCWRRVCAQFWDGPEFDSTLDADAPINPGGIAGHRNPDLDPSFWMMDMGLPPQITAMDFSHPEARSDTNFYNEVVQAGYIDAVLHSHPGERPCTPPDQRPSITLERDAASPTSIASLDVVSCSFPTMGFRIPDLTPGYAPGAHPVEPSSIYNDPDPIAATPRALNGKRVRPQNAHKRNDSLTDSLRDHDTSITEKVLYKNAEFLLTLPYAGSLVRGNLMPPGQAFVDIQPLKSAASRDTTVFERPQPPQPRADKGAASAMSGAGMRKLLGSVRKALSHKTPNNSSAESNFISLETIGPRGVTENRIPGTPVVPQARLTRIGGSRPAVRIDMLGAEIAEDFKKAVREDNAAGIPSEFLSNDFPTKLPGDNIEYSAAHLDSSFDLQPDFRARILSDTAITCGSKSIVIVDGTAPEDYHAMTGALGPPPHNDSVEAVSENFVHTGADPTPPTTPPDKAMEGNPRRSSIILSPQLLRYSTSEDPLPPFVPDLATLGAGRSPVDPRVHERRSMGSTTQSATSSQLPPLSSFRGHNRQQSSRSYRSRGSMAHRRWASVNSVFPQSTVKSFDATTVFTDEFAPRESVPSMPAPVRVLRRRPGGDLRGVQNVADLDAPLHRTRSVGSLTTYSESIRSSYIRSPVTGSGGFVDVVSIDYSQRRGTIFSLGAMAEKPNERQVSLFSTHSSKPAMAPSFEAEAKKLAEIPDDDDDCGPASALAKLEGKYEKSPSRLTILSQTFAASSVGEVSPQSPVSPESQVDHFTPEKRRNRHQLMDDGVSMLSEPMDEAQDVARATLEEAHSDARSLLSDGSRESYNSVPLLRRGLTDDGQSKITTKEWTHQSILRDSGDESTPRDEKPESGFPENLSYEIVEKTESMEKIKAQDDDPRDSGVHSFLKVGDHEDSDLSSELSFDSSEAGGFGPEPAQQSSQHGDVDKAIPHSSPRESVGTSEGARSPHMPPEASNVPELHEQQLQVWPSKEMPPTPDTTPTTAHYQPHPDLPDDTAGGEHVPLRSLGTKPGNFAAHLPFILAFSSDVLAQQFTLIEKDALNEVDWKELVDMRWKNTHTDSRSWVDFLRNSDARGVEVVVARFNIMVKWVVSEIVLTQDLEERARCIIKFIHVAAHCRKYRNFATMSQIAIALTSNEIARLTKTWTLVPAFDMKTMQALESLISPTKNFYNLRAEMEGGATTAETGCIPFVGIYTHDLLFNSQRPSEIASSPTTAPLVNFERCRIAASVVKTLLRLLEASMLYDFQPIEGITERCLWMSALNDDEIRKHSQSLEPSLA